MTAGAIEAVLRYAYVHGYSCEQWAEPTRQCFQRVDHKLDKELCDVLLNQIFCLIRVADPLLESYLTFATTGHKDLTSPLLPGASLLDPIFISPKVLLQSLAQYVDSTAGRNPRQWAYLLRLVSVLLAPLDAEKIVNSVHQQKIVDSDQPSQDDWFDVLATVFVMLSRLVAVGLEHESRDREPKPGPRLVRSAISFQRGNTQPGDISTIWPSSSNYLSSQTSAYDPEATIDEDSFGHEALEEEKEQDIKSSAKRRRTGAGDGIGAGARNGSGNEEDEDEEDEEEKIERSNAIMASQIMIDLIEKKSAKRMFEVRQNQKRQHGHESTSEEPWATCQEILTGPSLHSSSKKSGVGSLRQNPHVQKLLILIGRLTDRNLERMMAVHMKYHELEDEGTARAMPSAGLMGLLYHVVQIRPTLDDETIVDHLIKLQTIKGSFDESFYLELWFTALTGLREASFGTSCQTQSFESKLEKNTVDRKEKSCNNAIATNRLLWRSLVLVKLPHLIKMMQKKSEAKASRRPWKEHKGGFKDDVVEKELNPLESSLLELKAFTGLLNACSPPACCSDFYAPSSQSSDLVDKLGRGSTEDEDDALMTLINTISDDFNTPTVTKAIRSISTESIFLNMVHVCESYGFIRPHVVRILSCSSSAAGGSGSATVSSSVNKTECDTTTDLMDTDILDMDSPLGNNNSNSKTHRNLMEDPEDCSMDSIEIIRQNIEARMESILIECSMTAVRELLEISIVSLVHLRRIIDFLIDLLQQKASLGDIETIAQICSAMNAYPCIVDLIIQLYSPLAFMGPFEELCNGWSPSDSGMFIDEEEEVKSAKSLYNEFGTIWIFVSFVVDRFNLIRDLDRVFRVREGFCYQFFSQGPVVYGIDASVPDMEVWVSKWQNALFENDVTGELLREMTPQRLLAIGPTIIKRVMMSFEEDEMGVSLLPSVLDYLQEPYLHFTLGPILMLLCDELMSTQYRTALMCLDRLIIEGNLPELLVRQCGGVILGSLESIAGENQTYNNGENDAEENERKRARMNRIKTRVESIMEIEDSDARFPPTETVTTRVTRHSLFSKTQEMFRAIVKGGRSMFMRDMDADTHALWDQSKGTTQMVAHYLDMVLFQTALEMGGPRWFISMIVQEVLEAGKSGGAVRAAELGSCLIAIPLSFSSHGHNGCVYLLQCLLQDILPSSLRQSAANNGSFFQGQTLGVFTSDCLVLMHGRPLDDKLDDTDDRMVRALGRIFLNSLGMEGHETSQPSEADVMECGQFAEWTGDITKSAVWRGFIKGLMSNPSINDAWPDAFIY
ncbi:hypothetical protein J3Q64DRAFT_1852157 [Phycomyces blakesleeanus]|uniref:Mediator of RNA polymerase II transcription subunit 5 n=2 Tax=Phycomyces blakesleeanus TaxID=4837 RepID=A0A162NKV9_PHYB8|nr:hypothetical protein PHYBLDRAFT_181094 [Phycomyces blakesleeanus NRRL 1555(-)]OAD75158.1 hypothetical protein PHYBLDRAFT_181094 [Phycomyces blakesleeanus NRRL 1555(-)]|eukprot:XP_018293198.1 hypothetical protein PHYBLDRAFT_181094 [Phycomyces blakesleeanus NRRL 1555(-)]